MALPELLDKSIGLQISSNDWSEALIKTIMTPIKVQPERAPELARVPPRLLDYTVAVKNPKLQLAFEVARRGEVSEALSERLRVKLLKASLVVRVRRRRRDVALESDESRALVSEQKLLLAR